MLSLLTALVLTPPLSSLAIEYHEFDHEQEIHGERLGGLSGLSYSDGDCYAAVSDARDKPSIFRFCFSGDDLSWEQPLPLIHPSGEPMSAMQLDGEGLETSPSGWWMSAELTVENPDQFLFHIDRQGRVSESILLPPELADLELVSNGTFEALTRIADGSLLTALEKPPLNYPIDRSLLTPLVAINTATGDAVIRGYYPLDEVSDKVDRGVVALGVLPPLVSQEKPPSSDQIGLETLETATPPSYFFAVERHYEPGVGNKIVFFVFELVNAEEVPNTVSKQRWFELAELGIDSDNIEGAVIDSYGRLVLISDNNFSSHQRTQIIRIDFSSLFLL